MTLVRHALVSLFAAALFVPVACSGGGGSGGAGPEGDGGGDAVVGPTTDSAAMDSATGADAGDGTVLPTFCSSPCAPDSCCGGACTTLPLGSDTQNCGKCGVKCASGQVCGLGKCGCTPDCTNKKCGDDGCGGSCGQCGTGTACYGGTCGICKPSCAATGAMCGDDGCGGTCGTCPSGQYCATGQCQPLSMCMPQCGGKLCGDDNGCGSPCQGACPGGGSCTNGSCGQGCVPDCSGKECGNDGCGGQCGTCAYPDTCDGSGKCVCKPLCSKLGRACGNDGCGGTCGTCPSGQVCADDSSPAVTATYQCLDQSVGCADGTREGFKNTTTYPQIASCGAAFDGQSLRVTPTGQWCGNSLGKCTTPGDACSPGWHICMTNGWPKDLSSRLQAADCKSTVAGPGYYVAASALVVAQNNCTGPIPCPTSGNYGNQPICCGNSCGINSNDPTWSSCVWPDETPDAWPQMSGVGCGSWSSVGNGVLCCQDPPVTGQ